MSLPRSLARPSEMRQARAAPVESFRNVSVSRGKVPFPTSAPAFNLSSLHQLLSDLEYLLVRLDARVRDYFCIACRLGCYLVEKAHNIFFMAHNLTPIPNDIDFASRITVVYSAICLSHRTALKNRKHPTPATASQDRMPQAGLVVMIHVMDEVVYKAL